MANNPKIRIAQAEHYQLPIIITVTMASPTVNTGSTDQATATATQNGSSIALPAGTWSSSDPTNAPVNSSGLVTGNGATTAIITYTVTATGVHGSASCQVIAAPSLPQYISSVDPNVFTSQADYLAQVQSSSASYFTPSSLTLVGPISAGTNQTVSVSNPTTVWSTTNGTGLFGSDTLTGGSGNSGTPLLVDTSGSGVQETVTVKSFDPVAGTITADFAHSHAGGSITATRVWLGTANGSLGSSTNPFPTFSGVTAADLFTVDSVNTYNGKRTLRQRFPGNTNKSGQLAHNLAPLTQQGGVPGTSSTFPTGFYALQYLRIDPYYYSVQYPGQSVGVNYGPFPAGAIPTNPAGFNASYKLLNWVFYNYNGRTEIEFANTNRTKSDLTLASNPQAKSFQFNPGGSTVQVISTNGASNGMGGVWINSGTGNFTAPFSDGNWYALLMCQLPFPATGGDADTLGNPISYRQAVWFGRVTDVLSQGTPASIPKVMDIKWQVLPQYRLDYIQPATTANPGLPVVNTVNITGSNSNLIRPPIEQFLNRGETRFYIPATVGDVADLPPAPTLGGASIPWGL